MRSSSTTEAADWNKGRFAISAQHLLFVFQSPFASCLSPLFLWTARSQTRAYRELDIVNETRHTGYRFFDGKGTYGGVLCVSTGGLQLQS